MGKSVKNEDQLSRIWTGRGLPTAFREFPAHATSSLKYRKMVLLIITRGEGGPLTLSQPAKPQTGDYYGQEATFN